MSAILSMIDRFQFSEDLFMANRYTPWTMIVLYIVGTLSLSKWSRKRPSPPVNTRPLSIAYNVTQVVLSFVTFLAAVWSIAQRGMRAPYLMVCEDEPSIMHGLLGLTCYTYYLTKYLEICDTVFLALRQKRLISLHLYHHAVMMIVVWTFQKSNVIILLWTVMVNSLIHTFMYYYYLMCDLKIPVWWKKYMTSAQITQLVTGFSFVGAWFYLRPIHNCQGGFYEVIIACMLNLILISFFFNFYTKTYKSEKGAPKKKSQ